MLAFLCLLAALILFLLAGLGVGARFNLGWLGLFALTLAAVLGNADALQPLL